MPATHVWGANLMALMRSMALFCLLGAVSYGQQSHVRVQKQTNPPPATHVVIDPPYPPVNKLQSLAPSVAQENPVPWPVRPEWVIVWVTMAYVYVSWRTLKAIARQANTMDTQASDARAANTAAALTTKATLDALQEQATQLQRQVKASHDGLRAWVGIELNENEPPPTQLGLGMIDQVNTLMIPKPPRFVWKMKNYGQTPAFIQRMGSTHACTEVPTLEHMSISRMQPLVTFLGSGKEVVNPIDIPETELREIVTRKAHWRILIKLEYLDAFDKTQTHETTASFHYYVQQHGKDPIKTGFYQEIDPTMNYNT